jgi:fibronectin-binding autotransporter adhesin
MFSGLSFFRHGEQVARRALRRERRPRKLRLEVLEARQMLASFGQSGTTLAIDLNADSESVGIVSHGATYALTLDASHTWTGVDTADVAGSGSSTLTVSAAAFTSIQVTDSNSGGAVTFEDSGGNVYAASFTVLLDNSPTGAITFNGASAFGPSGLSVSTQANIVVSSGASVTVDGGQLALDASTSQFQNAGTVSVGAGALTITADSVAIQNTLTADGGITLQPTTEAQTIGLNDSTGAFNLTSEELGYLVSSGTVTIGAAAGVGAVRIGGAGAINLSTKNFDLTLRGGDVTFANRLQLSQVPSTRRLTLSTGAVTSALAGSVDIQVGTLSLATGGPVGAANNPLAIDLANLEGAVNGDLFLTESNQVTIGEPLSTSDDHTIHLIGGQFILGADERIGDGSRLNVTGGTLNIGAWNDTVRGVTLTSGQITGSGVLTSTTTFQVQNGTISAKLGGSVGLIKTATGTVTLSGANQYTDTTVIQAGGTLRIDKDACLGRPLDGSAPGRLELRGRLEATATLELAADREILLGDPSGTIVVPVNRTMTVKGNMVGGGLIKRGLGTLVLAGDNSFSGGVEYVDQSAIRVDHANGLGTGTIHFTSNGTLQYGPGVTTDLSGQIAPWDPSVTVTINTGNNQVAFAMPLGHAGVAEPAPASGTLFKTGIGKLTLAPTDTTYPTQLELLYVEEGEFAVTRGLFQLLGSATPVASVYTGSTSLFVKNATLTIGGGTVITKESLLLNYGAGTNATLNVSGGKLEVPGDLVAGANRLATVNISVSGGAATEIIVGRDFIVGLEGSSTVNISAGTTRISGDLIAGQNGSGTVNVSGGNVYATSLRHVGGDDGALNLIGGTVEVDEVVHQTANNGSNDSLKVYLGAVDQDVQGTLITRRMYLDRTGGIDDGKTHEFLLFFDGGTLQAKADGNLIDGITDEVGNPVWQGLIDAVGPLNASAFIYIPGNFDANVLRPLVHDPMLADTRDGGLTKQGTGTLRLWAENTFTGPAIVQGGILALVNSSSNNTIAGAKFIDVQFGTTLDVTGLDTDTAADTLVLANGQTLKGTGTIQGNLIAASGSTVAPGGSGLAEGSSPGILKQAGNYDMEERSTLEIQIGGNTPGNGSGHHDQMLVTGAVSLGGGTLALSSSDNYVPQLGDEYTIIRNDGSQAVSGTFAGLPEGYVFDNFLNSSLLARISYRDGDGNDVVIRTFLPAAIGDRVWEDRNGDGLQDMKRTGPERHSGDLDGRRPMGHRSPSDNDDRRRRYLPIQRPNAVPRHLHGDG